PSNGRLIFIQNRVSLAGFKVINRTVGIYTEIMQAKTVNFIMMIHESEPEILLITAPVFPSIRIKNLPFTRRNFSRIFRKLCIGRFIQGPGDELQNLDPPSSQWNNSAIPQKPIPVSRNTPSTSL